jgi:hypothetical protein
MSRPSEMTQEICDAICDGIADGQSLRSICASEEMPNKSTVFRWLAADETFRDQYARAREAQADALFDDILDIADDGTNDFMTKKNADGADYEALNSEHIQRSKLRVDARKWMAGKLQPKKYGEKITHANDPENPIMVPVLNVSVSGNS